MQCLRTHPVCNSAVPVSSLPQVPAVVPVPHRRRRLTIDYHGGSGLHHQGWAQSELHEAPSAARSHVVAQATGSGRGNSPWPSRNDLISTSIGRSSGEDVKGVDDFDLLGKVATVKFHLKYKTSFGQAVKLLGSHPKLGSWNLKNALEMRWTSGDVWVANVPLPAGGVYEYKYVLIDYETKQALEWQMGSNAVLAVVVSETEVNVHDNWGNSPGAMVKVDDDTMTREGKLQKWATEMMGYWKEARRLQIELVHKNNESQSLRNELAQLRMELSLERENKMQAEAQVAELQLENAGLKAQLVQKTVELNNTLAEVLQLLDKELDEEDTEADDDEAYDNDEEEEEEEQQKQKQPTNTLFGQRLPTQLFPGGGNNNNNNNSNTNVASRTAASSRSRNGSR